MANPAKEESFDELADAVVRIVSRFSSQCKERGEEDMMYAANRAWHELTRTRDKRDRSK